MAGSLNNLLVVRAVGTGDNQTYTMLRAATFMEGVVFATNGGAGTVTIQSAAVPITAALNPATTDMAVKRPAAGGLIQDTAKALAVGAVLTFAVSANTLNYEGYAYLYPTPGVAG